MALSDDLIAYWSLDEASGNAIDAHGSNDLTETSGTIGATTGKVSGCRDFEAADTEWFQIADNADLSTGDIDFTFAAWVQLESLTDNIGILGKWGSNNEYALLFISSRLRLTVVNSSSTTTPAIWSADASTGTWYFVVGWHDAAANTVNIQVNNGTPVSASHAGGVRDGTNAFAIGNYFAGNTGTAWDGLIDEVGFWKRVLTSDERTELYNSGNGRDYAYIAGGGGGHPAMRRFGMSRSGLYLPRHRPIEIGRRGVHVI